VGGRTVLICIVHTIHTTVRIWHGNRSILSTVFEADFRILVVVYGSYGTVRTADYGHEKQGTEEVVQQYGFGMENEADLCGTDLVL
jgi:hypothetical protein